MMLFQVLIKLEKFRIAFIVSRVVYLQHCQSTFFQRAKMEDTLDLVT